MLVAFPEIFSMRHPKGSYLKVAQRPDMIADIAISSARIEK